MTKVNLEEVEVVTKIYSTDTHSFKIRADTLEKMRVGEKFLVKIGSKIQKSMKQLSDISDGKEWENSWVAIYQEITGQTKLVTK